MRVVSLTCYSTEILCALGAADLLVGVDDHSDFPVDAVRGLPRVGPDLDIDVERVAALRPDLVLASLTVPGHERIVERLARARLPFVATEPVSVRDVYDDVRKVARLVDRAADGERVVSHMRGEIEGPVADPCTGARRPAVLVEWWPKPVIVPGRLSWVRDLMDAAGARSPLDEEVKSRPITDEEARAMDPDVVVMAWCGVRVEKYRASVVTRRPGWAAIRAVREGRVHAIPEAFLGRPGPRLVDGVRALRALVAARADPGDPPGAR